MDEYETILDFNTRLRDIANLAFALGEKMSEDTLARKILRPLPKRFNMKDTTIEEAQDLITIKVDELIGSLQTLEMTIYDRLEKKNKSITFVSEEELSKNNLSEAITLIGRKFNRSLNKFQAKWKTNVPDKMSNIGSQSKVKDEDNSYQDKGVRYFECESFGHIRTECPNYLKKHKKVMIITLFDSDEENEGETTNKSFTRKYETSSDTSDEDLSDEDLTEAHKDLVVMWKNFVY
jgi:hypothetical protein